MEAADGGVWSTGVERWVWKGNSTEAAVERCQGTSVEGQMLGQL